MTPQSCPNRLAWLALAVPVFAILSAPDARGQAAGVRDRYATDGVVLPPTGVALVDEATAPEINPAGVGMLDKPQLMYLHERSLRADRVTDAGFIGTGVFGMGGLAFGVQWVRPHDAPSYRKMTWTVAAGRSDVFAVGFSFNKFASLFGTELDRLTSWDAGLTVRPWRYLSVAAAVRDFDGPTLDGVRLPRRFDLGLAFRPFTDRVSLAGDFLIDDRTGLPGARLSFAAQFEPLAGLIVSGGLATGLHGGDVVGQVALTLNMGYAGLTWWGGSGSDVAGGWDQAVQLRLSMDRYRPLPIARDKVVILDVSGLLSPSRGLLESLILPDCHDPYLEFLGLLERLREDRDVAGVLLKVSGLPEVGHARVEEMRAALMALRASHKHVWAIFFDGGDDEYLLASAAEKIWAVPQATFLVNGYTASATFLAGTLEKIGVGVDVARVGEYKTATDMFTRTEMSPEERKMLDAWLDGLYGRTTATLQKARGLSAEKLAAAIDQGILSARGAKEAGLVDDVIYPDELQAALERAYGHALDLVGAGTPRETNWPRRYAPRPRIAVIDVDGMIAEGKSRSDPLGLTKIAGAQSAIGALEKAMADPLVKAIVLRVDSTGGSGAASDLVWRAVRKVRERKPVAVSMGDYAASGGYYIAMAGERVFAEPSTLTGSIGVFAIKPHLGGLLEKLGVSRETLKRGDKSDIFSLTVPWSPSEQQAMQRYIDEFYDVFITRVAESRKLEKSKVDSVGRGRVFSGEEAVKEGLVDELGGLNDAIAWAKQRVGLDAAETDVELVRDTSFLDIKLNTQSDEMVRLGKLLGDAAQEVGVALELPEGPLAMLPYRVRAK